jgi:hypothetical protein
MRAVQLIIWRPVDVLRISTFPSPRLAPTRFSSVNFPHQPNPHCKGTYAFAPASRRHQQLGVAGFRRAGVGRKIGDRTGATCFIGGSDVVSAGSRPPPTRTRKGELHKSPDAARAQQYVDLSRRVVVRRNLESSG